MIYDMVVARSSKLLLEDDLTTAKSFSWDCHGVHNLATAISFS
jgi:hypothetical protein